MIWLGLYLYHVLSTTYTLIYNTNIGINSQEHNTGAHCLLCMFNYQRRPMKHKSSANASRRGSSLTVSNYYMQYWEAGRSFTSNMKNCQSSNHLLGILVEASEHLFYECFVINKFWFNLKGSCRIKITSEKVSWRLLTNNAVIKSDTTVC